MAAGICVDVPGIYVIIKCSANVPGLEFTVISSHTPSLSSIVKLVLVAKIQVGSSKEIRAGELFPCWREYYVS